jgi:mRNA-degrading endonuclease RelE of RelBE toxin-antitoxin system
MKTIKWTVPAQADVRRIDRSNAMQVFKTIEHFAHTGQGGDVKRLRPPRTGLRLRAGDWRVFFVEEGSDAIRILRVLHRSEAYR